MARAAPKTGLATRPALIVLAIVLLAGCAGAGWQVDGAAAAAAGPAATVAADSGLGAAAIPPPPAGAVPEADRQGVATMPSKAAPLRRSLPAMPITDVFEVRDLLAEMPAIDLTVPSEDIWERIRTGFAMPNLHGSEVEDREAWYAHRPATIGRIAERSRLYLYFILDELEERGMPTELALLPMVESAFNPLAYSRAHASGLWQFIPSTGKAYNLKQNWWYDGRRDIVASTRAALDYLQFLYAMHGDWHLALASYNWGENAVARAVERNRSQGLPTDYSSLRMPAETRQYVPKLQALKNIIADPAEFNVELDPIPNQPYFVTVDVGDIDVKVAAGLAEMPVQELVALNPGHKRPVILARQSDRLVLPADRADVFKANLKKRALPLVSWKTHRLQRGESLARLARRHGISLTSLKHANGITRRTRIKYGMSLLVPTKVVKSASSKRIPRVSVPPNSKKLVHVVKAGDTLSGIARRYGTAVRNLQGWNRLRGTTIKIGQKIVIYRRVATKQAKPAG